MKQKMSGKILRECNKDHYFCDCSFSCRSVKIWNDHKKECPENKKW